MKRIATFMTLCGLMALPAMAQRFTGFIGGGFSEPINPLGQHLDRGWNVAGGVGVSNDNIGAMVDFTFVNHPLNQTTLNNVGAPDGTARFWSVTLDPVLHATQKGPADFYITGGAGLYHRTVEFTQPALVPVVGFDPWFGFFPATAVTNEVIGSYGVYKLGVNGGAGVSFKLGNSPAKIFAEARFHHMFTNRMDSNYIPVTFGIRW